MLGLAGDDDATLRASEFTLKLLVEYLNVMKPAPTVALRTTEHDHVMAERTAHFAITIFPWAIGQYLAVSLAPVATGIVNLLVVGQRFEHGSFAALAGVELGEVGQTLAFGRERVLLLDLTGTNAFLQTHVPVDLGDAQRRIRTFGGEVV